MPFLNPLNILPGKKTYIVVILTILGFWGAFLGGEVDLMTTIQMTVEAVLAAGIRLGITAQGMVLRKKE